MDPVSQRPVADSRRQSVVSAIDFSARELLLEGIPATEIVRVANQEETDIIAMGGRGSFAAGQEFLGSVAKRVIQTAPCPVLTVPSLLSRRMRSLI